MIHRYSSSRGPLKGFSERACLLLPEIISLKISQYMRSFKW
jgi:hypothetical protein